METLFKKVAVFTDLHLGLKSNSITHNQDCEEFIDWFISTAKENNCETGMFLGDFHHHRNTLNIVTMDFSIRILEKLGQAFDQFFFITGNHDMYYKDKRDVHSALFGKYIPGITVIQEPTTIKDVTFLPWLVNNEWKAVSKLKSKYVFGHLELPNFYMNAQVKMPDHGQLQAGHFKNQDYVFSGHFHKRQTGTNITYIGNAFPHNYADVGDDARGMMMLEWNSTPEYHAWPNQPVFRTYKLSSIIDNPDALLKEKMYCRVTIDVPLSFEEANFIRETFVSQYKLRELMLVPEKVDIDMNSTTADINFESVDTIVINQITNIDSETFNKNLLLEIYNNL